MNIIISNNSSIPIFEQIENAIKQAIFSNELKEEEMLPSVRNLANDLKISFLTVKRAYDELEKAGFIKSVQGKGTFVAPKNIELIKEEKLKEIKDYIEKIYNISKISNISEEEIKEIDDMLNGVSSERLVNLIYSLSEIQNNMKLTTQKSILFQAGMIKLCYNNASSKDSSIGTDSNLEKRIEKIENYLKSNGTRNIETNIIKPSYISNNIEAKPKGVASEEKTNVVKSKINENNKVSYQGKIEDSWPKIVNDLKQNGKIVLFSNLMDTKATQLNDMTVGIQFPKGINAFGKTILEKQENIHELTRLVSIACGKQMNIKYIDTSTSNVIEDSVENDIKNLVNDSDISFNITD